MAELLRQNGILSMLLDAIGLYSGEDHGDAVTQTNSRLAKFSVDISPSKPYHPTLASSFILMNDESHGSNKQRYL